MQRTRFSVVSAAARLTAGDALQMAGVRLALGLRLAALQAVKLAGEAFLARGDVLGLHLTALHGVKLVGSALFQTGRKADVSVRVRGPSR